jgi:hypothetical protein
MAPKVWVSTVLCWAYWLMGELVTSSKVEARLSNNSVGLSDRKDSRRLKAYVTAVGKVCLFIKVRRRYKKSKSSV